MPQHSLVGKGLLIIKASWLHSDTPSSIGLLWTCDQPDAENLPHNREKPVSPAGFETAIPASKRPQNNALGLASTGISIRRHTAIKVNKFSYKLSVIVVIVWKKNTWIFSTRFIKNFQRKISIMALQGSRVAPCGEMDETKNSGLLTWQPLFTRLQTRLKDRFAHRVKTLHHIVRNAKQKFQPLYGDAWSLHCDL